jgi:hypothetical protein
MEKTNLFMFSQNHKNLNQIQEKTQIVWISQNHKKEV